MELGPLEIGYKYMAQMGGETNALFSLTKMGLGRKRYSSLCGLSVSLL